MNVYKGNSLGHAVTTIVYMDAQARRDIVLLQETVRFQADMLQYAMSQIATMRSEVSAMRRRRESSTPSSVDIPGFVTSSAARNCEIHLF